MPEERSYYRFEETDGAYCVPSKAGLRVHFGIGVSGRSLDIRCVYPCQGVDARHIQIVLGALPAAILVFDALSVSKQELYLGRLEGLALTETGVLF